MKPRTRRSLSVVIALFLSAASHGLTVTRVEIKTRADVGLSGYEKIIGTIHFAVDPNDPRNRVVAISQGAGERLGTRRVLRPILHPEAEAADASNGAALVTC